MERIAPKEEDLSSAARGWVARLVSGDTDEDELASFQAWRASSTAHAAAFDDARRLYAITAARPEVERAFRRSAGTRRRLVWGALAASFLLGVLLVRPEFLFPPDFSVADGPAHGVVLQDGSRVLLDGASAIDVHFSARRREIVLRRGRAWFDVAHDPGRPFVVLAKGGRATAIGTAYTVDATGSAGVEVDVLRGTVRTEQSGFIRVVRAGHAARWSGSGPVEMRRSRERLAWLAGHIVIDGQRFADAAALLDHYIPGRIVVLGSMRNARVGGVFATDRAEQGFMALARSQGARVHRIGGLILVSGW
ncbi:FecR family protein [Sphingomonas sp. OTU376]|uniref:FecR family protein n=1 Tax=Sphingomonas sp. OTU376 TaxID=3043863 RepID=UPI00313C36F6